MPVDQFPKIYLYRRIVQAKLFMDNHFSQPMDLHDIAEEAYFSKFHFIRLFKSIYKKTPHQYLISVRVEKAKLLLQKSLPVHEVCFAVGFDSVSSFTGLFKRMTGVSPSTYQQQQLARYKEIGERPLKFIPNCFAEQKGWKRKQVLERMEEKIK
jgi:AraC-like DNA-binding protein